MNLWRDPFPRTPQGFHTRVEQTLCGLEEKNMKHIRYRKLIVAIAALVAALAVTAVAAVIGQSRLKDALRQEGLDEVAGLVQEVHLGDSPEAEDSFAFTVDELIWEGGKLFVSYSVRVPEDGKYLVALHAPRLNDRPLAYDAPGFNVARFYEEDRTVLVFNDEYGHSCGDLLTFTVDPALKDRSDNALEFHAELLKTDLDFEAASDFGEFLNPPHTAGLDIDNLRFEDPSGPESKALLEKLHGIADRYGALTLDKFVAAGFAERVDEREITLSLDAAALPQVLYNDVENHDFDVKGVHLHIDSFRLSHMGISMKYTISVPGAQGEDPKAIALLNAYDSTGDWSLDFGTIDGKPLYRIGLLLGGGGSGGWAPLEDGTPAYSLSEKRTAMLPLEGLSQLIFAPRHFPEDENGNQLAPVYDMENAVVLTPVFNPAIAESEARESAERSDAAQRFAEEYDGDPKALVYATQNGIYYHTLPDCSGMHFANPMIVADAVAAGKLACPRCAEGDGPDISEPEEGEDTLCW